MAYGPNAVATIVSWMLGSLDLSYNILRWILGTKRPKFFALGWGDLSSLDKATELFKQQSCQADWQPPASLLPHISLRNIREADGDILVQDGAFPSPLSDFLPEECKTCHVCFVKPKVDFTAGSSRDEESGSQVVIIMLPATGEQGLYGNRLRMAKYFARQYGWCSVIVEAPFYGFRKPMQQSVHYIDNVSHFLLQSYSIIQESAALALHFLEENKGSSSSVWDAIGTERSVNQMLPTTISRYHSRPTSSPSSSPMSNINKAVSSEVGDSIIARDSSRVCITGFSWGAAMASSSAALSLLWGADGTRLACVPYVGSASSAVLVDGLLQDDIDWAALQAHPQEGLEDTRSRLFDKLYLTQLSTFSDEIERRNLEISASSTTTTSSSTTTATSTTKTASTHEFYETTSLLGTSGSLLMRRLVGAVRGVAMLHDYFIKPQYAAELYSELKRLCSPSYLPLALSSQPRSELHIVGPGPSQAVPPRLSLRWLWGGHVLALLIQWTYHAGAIVEAVQSLDMVYLSDKK